MNFRTFSFTAKIKHVTQTSFVQVTFLGELTKRRLNIPYLRPYLPCGVPFSQCSAVRFLVNCVEIHSDTERNGYLVGSCVAPADRSAGVVHFVGNIQFC